MSIKSEIDRIEQAKAAIGTELRGKGVDVPETTKLDGYPALVRSIQSGSTGTEKRINITQNGVQEFSPDPGTLISKLIVQTTVPTEGAIGLPGVKKFMKMTYTPDIEDSSPFYFLDTDVAGMLVYTSSPNLSQGEIGSSFIWACNPMDKGSTYSSRVMGIGESNQLNDDVGYMISDGEMFSFTDLEGRPKALQVGVKYHFVFLSV